MAAMEYGEVDGTEELQSSQANVSLDDGDELIRLRLKYDLDVRLIVALQIQKLKIDFKKNINVYGSLLRDLDCASDRLRHRVVANRMAREELDIDDCADADDHEQKEEKENDDDDDEEEENIALREMRDMYVKASGVDDRYKEFDEIVWVHYDPDLDNETRKATVARLWRHLEKELDDRADAVTSGEFEYAYAPFTPTHQSLRSSSVQRN